MLCCYIPMVPFFLPQEILETLSSLSSYSVLFLMWMLGFTFKGVFKWIISSWRDLSRRATLLPAFTLSTIRNQTEEMKPLSDRLKRTASTLLRQEGWNLRPRFPSYSGNDKSKTRFTTQDVAPLHMRRKYHLRRDLVWIRNKGYSWWEKTCVQEIQMN